MADGDERTFTESEHLAVLNDRVAAETREISTERDGLKTENDDLKSKLDVEQSARAAAETERDAARKELEDFKTEITEREAAAERKDDRLAKVREVAAHLPETFLDEATEDGKDRVARIVAMADETFTAYVGDLAAAAPKSTGGGTGTGTSAPRETAMKGAEGGAGEKGDSNARMFLLGGKVGLGSSEKVS